MGAKPKFVRGAVLELEGFELGLGGAGSLRIPQATLDRGHLLVIRGANGTGKTTLLNALSGVVPRAAGRLRIEGIDLPAGRDRASGGWPSVGRSFQVPFLLEHLDAVENVLLGIRDPGEGLRGWLRASFWGPAADGDRRRAAELLEKLRLTSYGAHPAGRLSTGLRRRVDLARAFLAPATLLLLDEPYAGLDAEGLTLVDALLSERLRQGAAAVLVEHEGEKRHRRAHATLALVREGAEIRGSVTTEGMS